MQKIVVFQQNGSGKFKIQGMKKFGQDHFQIKTHDIDDVLPPILDDTSEYLPEAIDADLVLDYMKHLDLSEDLSVLCQRLGIPLIASGKKITSGAAICTPICCTLPENKDLGDYSRFFGAPKLEVDVENDRIKEMRVKRGAPCGATWLAAEKVKGLPVEEALTRFGLEVQFFCSANPAGWDPMYGKSPVHLADEIHSAALKVGLKKIHYAVHSTN